MLKIKGNKTFGKPFNRFNMNGFKCMQLRDEDHSTFDRSKADRSSLMMEVATWFPTEDRPNIPDHTSVEIGMHETSHYANGRQTTRAITTSLPMMEALKLAKFILEAAANQSDEARAEAARIAANLNVVQHADDGK